jgi:imidazolonepropionase-like amidohydrolase
MPAGLEEETWTGTMTASTVVLRSTAADFCGHVTRNSAMLKTVLAAGLLMSASVAAHAACSADDMLNKTSAVSDVLMDKMETKTDEASKLMSEMGAITSVTPPTDASCAKMDALLAKAKAL